MSDPPRKVAVVGVTGYTGFELARLLLRHPQIEKPTFYLREGSSHIRCLTELFPQLRGWGEAPCRPLSVDAIAASGAATVFLSTPHEASTELAPQLIAKGLRVVDLSGAFRFHDAATYTQWYKLPAPPQELLNEAVYGLPEIYSDKLPSARIVANPGCYATSVILGLKPLVESGWVAKERGIVCDCKSGASGAERTETRHTVVEVDENFRAYGLFTHAFASYRTSACHRMMVANASFTRSARGILSTLYVWLNEPRPRSRRYGIFVPGNFMRTARWCVCGP